MTDLLSYVFFSFTCEKEIEAVLLVFYCRSFLHVVYIMASITYSSLLFTERSVLKGSDHLNPKEMLDGLK